MIAGWKATMETRINNTMRQHVDVGAFVGDYGSVYAGAAYMRRHGISLEVARRVLLTPSKRRAS